MTDDLPRIGDSKQKLCGKITLAVKPEVKELYDVLMWKYRINAAELIRRYMQQEFPRIIEENSPTS